MPETATLLAFAGTSLALLVIPGPTMMYIVARGIHQGRAAALISTLGVELGTLLQLLAASLGLAVLVSSSAYAFATLKYLGAAYLLWLAGAAIWEQAGPGGDPDRPAALRSIFLQGILVEVLNPKTALFFLAFLPQFTGPAGGPVQWQFLALGLVFVLMALCYDTLISLVAGALGRRISCRGRLAELHSVATAGIYFSLATFVAIPL